MTLRRVIYASRQPYVIRAAEMVRDAAGWQPVYWLCRSGQETELAQRFGTKIIFHDYFDAIRGLSAPDLHNDYVIPFDPARLEPEVESVALAMLERNDSYSDSMSYRERVDYVLTGLGYWCSVLQSTAADTVIFEEVPHQAADYLLYIAARSRGLLTIVPVRGLPDAGFQPNDAIGQRCPALDGTRQTLAPGPRPGTGAISFLDRMSLDYRAHLEAMFWDHSTSIKEITRENGLGRQVLQLLRDRRPKHAPHRYWRNLMSFRNDQKVRSRTLAESEMSYFSFLWHKTRTLVRKTRLRRIYSALANPKPDLQQPYVYCCLQFQPEASTSPLAGRYVYQWLMVEQLVAALPDGWRLYVKEHPSQFSGEYARYGETFRSRHFYERLLQNGRTELMPLTLDSFKLIDNARVVAGPGGTVCFEAVARGKPAISFGGGFFVGCPGVLQVKDADDVTEAMRQVQEGFTADPEAVRHFAEAIDCHTYPGAIGGPNQLERMGVDVERNAELHRDCWLEVASWSEIAAQPATSAQNRRGLDQPAFR